MKFDSYHPAIPFLFFSAALFLALSFNQPVFFGIGFSCAFISAVLFGGKKTALFCLCLIPASFLYALVYAYFTHFGVTNLAVNVIGNQITLEALVTGFVIGLKGGEVLMWLSCVNRIITKEKVLYLFGRVSPKLSLLLSILFRQWPEIKSRAKTINCAQTGIGKGAGQGHIGKRIKNGVRILSILLTWIMERAADASLSMKSRGFTKKGRTAFEIYRFDHRDRGVVLTLFSLIALLVMGILLDQTKIRYHPMIEMNRVTTLSGVFYVGYTLFLLFPCLLQIAGEKNYERKKRQHFSLSKRSST